MRLHPINQKNNQQEPIYPDIFNSVQNMVSMPIYSELTHNGFWITTSEGIHVPTLNEKCDRNSVMLKPTCLFYVYKIAFRHLLLSMDIIQPTDIDPANLVPHIMVRKNPLDPFSKYASIQNEKFLINESDLSSKSDFLMIELDKKKDLHMTIIFSKGISKRINLVSAFHNLLKLLNYRTDLIELYSSLEYFGSKEIEYWYETKHLYPDNICIPVDYVKPTREIQMVYTTTEAGSVIMNK
jgi:hypothetical protein